MPASALDMNAPPALAHQPPRIRALLEQAWALEMGNQGQTKDHEHAAALYCEAARHGSAEGHYRTGLIYLRGDEGMRDKTLARSFLAYAHQLGHPLAEIDLASIDNLAGIAVTFPKCLREDYVYAPRPKSFDLDAYVVAQQPIRREIAQLVAKLAPEYGIDPHLALAIAAVESNFDPHAVSPKHAIGIMQLIPETARRFNVADPFDAEQNIRGGLSYLKWLTRHFSGQIEKVIAAYNAGEGTVRRYDGTPPFAETRAYLARVMSLAAKNQAQSAK